MNSAVTSQVTIFLFSIVLGAVLSVLFDGFRVVNAVFRANWKRIFFEDIVYFILSAIITFTYILIMNMGEIRFYIIWGELIGWVIYRLTIGKFIYKILLSAIKFVVKWLTKFKVFVISKIPKEKIKKLTSRFKLLRPKFIKSDKLKKIFLQKLRFNPKNKKECPNYREGKN